MNILILVSHLGTYGGTHRVACSLANRLVEDYEVHVAAVYNEDEKSLYHLDERIIQKVFLPSEKRLRSMALDLYKPFRRYLKEHEIDLVLLIGNYQSFIALPAILTTNNVCFVFCDHGALMNQWDSRALRIIHRLGSKFCDTTVVLTEQSRQDYITHLHRNPNRVKVIPNWIDPTLTEKQLEYNVQSKTILWAGRLDHEKGIHYLFDIARLVLPERPDWQWLVFGTGELEDELKTSIKQAGLEKQLILKGYSENLYEEYPSCAICTLTSEREGLPVVLLEAKACKIPLVSFDVVTGPREIICDGVDGFLVKPYDTAEFAVKLAQLMDNEQLRREFSDRAADTVGRFSADPIYSQWQELIENLN